jgi:hypothetical protein
MAHLRQNKKPGPADDLSSLLAPAIEALALVDFHVHIALAVLAVEAYMLGLLAWQNALETLVSSADRTGEPPVLCW